MSKLWIACLASLSLSAPKLSSQSAALPQELTFQVSAASWTDTGLDLQSGDKITISGASAATSENAGNSALPLCTPAGVKDSAAQNLPLPSAASGALIARLHAHGAAPVLVGESVALNIEQPSHLFLGMNVAGTPPCQGSFTVKVEKGSAAATGASDASAETRGGHLKSQLSAAAQVFMAGQFGIGNKDSSSETSAASNAYSGTGTSYNSSLSVSTQTLDADLRKDLDSLPRRVNDQFNNLGDMVNFVIVGSEKDLQAALEAATWHIADTDNRKAVLNAFMQTYDQKDYLAMPMSTLYLFGRKQDYGFEMAEPIAMAASRHHFRIWKAPFTWNGKEVWVGAGTHDIGFAKDKRNNNVTHKIDPAVDGERDNIGGSLQKANKVKSATYYLPPDPVQDAKNATGDGYHSDGRLLVVFLP